MIKLHLDFETRSAVDLTKVGAWAYASHPSTDIICMGYTVGEKEPVRVLKRDEIIDPRPLGPWSPSYKNVRIVAHNAAFEYAIYYFILHKRYGWPPLNDPARWDCTMARAYACGLPPSLFGLGLALKLPIKKDLEARQALMKICKPQKDGTWNEDPALYEIVYKYNAQDVDVERAADRVLPELSTDERKVFEADLLINRRGILIDLGSARKAAQIAESLTDGLNADLRRVTNGAVSKASRVAELKRWVTAQGVAIPTKTKVDKETNEEQIKETLDVEAVKDLIKDPAVPAVVKKVIGIRQQVGKSSVAKLKTMLSCVCNDQRFRGAFQFHGSHTGRWAGRLLQLQNFPQGLVGEEQEFAIKMLDEGAGWFQLNFGDQSMQTLSDILRGLLVAAPGKIFVGADLNAIEARVIFWLAGESGALAQYALGESPYLTMGEKIYGRKISRKDVTEYKIAKMTVLGAGFGMGWVRFQAQVYSESAKRGDPLEISDELAQSAIKGYREYYRGVPRFWYETEKAVVNAIQNPNSPFATADGKVLWAMSSDRRFLTAKLPSGRLLRYYRPSVVTGTDKFGNEKPEIRYWSQAGEGAIRLDCMNLLGEYRTWGGELVENVVQAVARDVMAQGILNVEAAGFSVVLHAHDEIVSEVDENSAHMNLRDGVKDFENIMCKMPAWASTLPLKAEGFYGARYRK